MEPPEFTAEEQAIIREHGKALCLPVTCSFSATACSDRAAMPAPAALLYGPPLLNIEGQSHTAGASW